MKGYMESCTKEKPNWKNSAMAGEYNKFKHKVFLVSKNRMNKKNADEKS
jgi:hypothetical protein